jgi:enamine deaminase RidA (YjgF/YER057c/UK114 family)
LIREQVRESGGFQEAAAYSRAVRAGAWVVVSGTAALDADGAALHPGDCRAQTLAALRRAVAAAGELGASVGDVVRTRIILVPGADWRGAADAHREVFAGVNPANTTYFCGGLIPPGALVEVELDALVDEIPPR